MQPALQPTVVHEQTRDGGGLRILIPVRFHRLGEPREHLAFFARQGAKPVIRLFVIFVIVVKCFPPVEDPRDSEASPPR